MQHLKICLLITDQKLPEFCVIFRAAGLKCRSQVTGYRPQVRSQVTGHSSDYRPQIRSQVTKNDRTLDKTVLD